MGMECTAAIRSSSPVAFVRRQPWFNGAQRDQPANAANDQQNDESILGPQSAPNRIFSPLHSPLQHFCTSPLGFCRRAASFPLASAALHEAQQAGAEESAVFAAATSAPQQRPSLLLWGPALKVRSQSESAALNKLAQMEISRVVPRSLLDEFQWQNRLQHFRQTPHEQSTTTGTPTTMNNTSSTGPNGMGRQQREVKFFAQQPLQSDSEGEDSLVSTPDEEPSPSNSCAEEEDDDVVPNEKQQHPSLDPDQFEVEEEDLGLGPMDEEIERDRDRLAARTFEQQLQDAIEELPPEHHPHPALSSSTLSLDSSLLEMARCDDSGYATVPSMLASLDIAQPAQPSPMIQLPLQLPLVTIDLATICANAMAASHEKSSCIKEEPAEEKIEENDQIVPLRMPPKKPRRQVRFADDCGQCLETVRVMTEPSDYPPKISPAVLRRCRRAAALSMQKEGGGANGQTLPGGQVQTVGDDSDELDSDDNEKRPRSTWKLGFKQPASEYVKFRETLDTQKVALENVMLKNEQGRMIGTIKVANIAFEKEVFIRLTANRWKSFTDKPAQYQSSPSKTFDTFRFDIEIPRNEAKDSRLEFCVCFRAKNDENQQEYWDSNGGRNFALCSPEPETPSSPLFPAGYGQKQPPKMEGTPVKSKARNIVVTQTRLDREDPYRMEWNSPSGWSSTNFAAWRQLSTEGPYWSSCAAPLTPPLPTLLNFGQQGFGGGDNPNATTLAK